jgi:protein-tyrosine phosphatase
VTEARFVALEGVNNLRDYGGYAIPGGGRVKRGLLWRSGQHVGATDADLEIISGLALATVTDLRGDSERQLNPCRRHHSFTAQVLTCEGETAGLASHLDAANGVIDEKGARAAMRRLYAEMAWRPNLVAVLRRHFAVLADGSGPSLIHCYAGKDRTGMAVALVHHVLGVHPDDMMADYLLTNEATKNRTLPGSSGSDGAKYAALSKEAAQALFFVDASYLETGLAAIRSRHGSLDAYLEEVLAVGPDLQNLIRANYVMG